MVPDPGHPYAKDARSTDELVAVHLADPESDDGRAAIGVLHYRGGEAEFAHGARLAKSAAEAERIAGANILAQLGWQERAFLEESVTMLLLLLRDPSDAVVCAAGIALGHREHPSAIEPLVELTRHPNAEVRFGVVHGLLPHPDATAVATLVELARDRDRDVRDWATFGIARREGFDSPELIDVLLVRAGDEDPEVRGEALVGLAMRRHARALELVRGELEGEFHGDWAVEAAELLADPSLGPVLESLHARLDQEDRAHFRSAFRSALDACKPKP